MSDNEDIERLFYKENLDDLVNRLAEERLREAEMYISEHAQGITTLIEPNNEKINEN